MIGLDRSGWWLPNPDTYFARFMPGSAPKRNGFMREHLLEAFRHVRAWMVAIDCGAHVGFWTFDLAQKFMTVHAFEACPTTYACLLKNTEEFGNVRAYNLAVGEKSGRCDVRGDPARPGNTGSNFIMPSENGVVSMVALDEMGIEGCDLLKVDVEGYELNVLRGARKLIDEHRPVIIMECSDRKFAGRYQIPEGEAERWLLKRRYRERAYMRPDKVFVPL